MKIHTGIVVSDKMKQSVVIEVDRLVAHPKYLKQMHRTTRYHADNQVSAKLGDLVKFVACKPMSKTKFYKVKEILKLTK